jgi:hypothetical protein
LSNGNYTWSVNCTDIYGNEGSSTTQTLLVSVKPAAPPPPGDGVGGAPTPKVPPVEEELEYALEIDTTPVSVNPGSGFILTGTAKNIGTGLLDNVFITLIDIPTTWQLIDSELIELLAVGESSPLYLQAQTSACAVPGDYSIYVEASRNGVILGRDVVTISITGDSETKIGLTLGAINYRRAFRENVEVTGTIRNVGSCPVDGVLSFDVYHYSEPVHVGTIAEIPLPLEPGDIVDISELDVVWEVSSEVEPGNYSIVGVYLTSYGRQEIAKDSVGVLISAPPTTYLMISKPVFIYFVILLALIILLFLLATRRRRKKPRRRRQKAAKAEKEEAADVKEIVHKEVQKELKGLTAAQKEELLRLKRRAEELDREVLGYTKEAKKAAKK